MLELELESKSYLLFWTKSSVLGPAKSFANPN
jgi:hypothetical protein